MQLHCPAVAPLAPPGRWSGDWREDGPMLLAELSPGSKQSLDARGRHELKRAGTSNVLAPARATFWRRHEQRFGAGTSNVLAMVSRERLPRQLTGGAMRLTVPRGIPWLPASRHFPGRHHVEPGARLPPTPGSGRGCGCECECLMSRPRGVQLGGRAGRPRLCLNASDPPGGGVTVRLTR